MRGFKAVGLNLRGNECIFGKWAGFPLASLTAFIHVKRLSKKRIHKLREPSHPDGQKPCKGTVFQCIVERDIPAFLPPSLQDPFPGLLLWKVQGWRLSRVATAHGKPRNGIWALHDKSQLRTLWKIAPSCPATASRRQWQCCSDSDVKAAGRLVCHHPLPHSSFTVQGFSS